MSTINFNNTNGIINFNSSSPLVLTDGVYAWGAISGEFVVGTPKSHTTRPAPSAFYDGVVIKETSTDLFLMCYNSTLFNAPSLINCVKDQDQYWVLPYYSTKIKVEYTYGSYVAEYITGHTTLDGAIFTFVATPSNMGNLLIKATGGTYTNQTLTYSTYWNPDTAMPTFKMSIGGSEFPRTGTGEFQCTIQNQSTNQRLISDGAHDGCLPLCEIEGSFDLDQDTRDTYEIEYQDKRLNSSTNSYFMPVYEDSLLLWSNNSYGIIYIEGEYRLNQLVIKTYGCTKK